jgi:hypothetical protein
MRHYRLADGVRRAQPLGVFVMETRPGMAKPVRVRKEVLVVPGKLVTTEYDLTNWVEAGLVVEVVLPAPVVPEVVAVEVPVVVVETPVEPSVETPDAAPVAVETEPRIATQLPSFARKLRRGER